MAKQTGIHSHSATHFGLPARTLSLSLIADLLVKKIGVCGETTSRAKKTDSSKKVKFRCVYSGLVPKNFFVLKNHIIFAASFAGIAQLVEHDLAKVGVASSSLVSRSAKAARVSGFVFQWRPEWWNR